MKRLWLILLAAPLFAQNPKPCTSVVNSAIAGQVLSANSNGSSPQCKWVAGGGGGSGTVTSVGLALPSSTFTVSGSPVTTSGTLTGTYKNQTANTVFSGPASGPAAAPTFRGLVAADLPAGTGTVTSVGSADASVVVTNPTTTPDLSVRKINGVAYPATPSNNTVPVVTSSNTITYEAVPNAALANSATTVNSQTCTLGSTCTVTAAPSGTAGGDLSGSYPNPGVAKINGTSFAGTNGHLVSFGASNTPADSGIVAANVLTGTATNHGVAIGGAAQALSFTSAGTSGNCLLSNGASADPTFQACPGGGLTVGTTTISGGTTTKVLFDNAGVLGEYAISGCASTNKGWRPCLEEHAGGGATTVDFSCPGTAGFDNFEFEVFDVVMATSGADLLVRYSTDGGSTYDSGTNYTYAGWRESDAGATQNGSAAGTSIDVLFGTAGPSLANFSIDGQMKLFHPAGTSLFKVATSQFSAYDGTSAGLHPVVSNTGSSQYKSTSAVTNVRFLGSSSSTITGTFRCYGIGK